MHFLHFSKHSLELPFSSLFSLVPPPHSLGSYHPINPDLLSHSNRRHTKYLPPWISHHFTLLHLSSSRESDGEGEGERMCVFVYRSPRTMTCIVENNSEQESSFSCSLLFRTTHTTSFCSCSLLLRTRHITSTFYCIFLLHLSTASFYCNFLLLTLSRAFLSAKTATAYICHTCIEWQRYVGSLNCTGWQSTVCSLICLVCFSGEKANFCDHDSFICPYAQLRKNTARWWQRAIGLCQLCAQHLPLHVHLHNCIHTRHKTHPHPQTTHTHTAPD